MKLDAAAVTPLSLTIHELATSAVKYGALSTAAGRIDVSWNVAGDPLGKRVFSMRWQERGGPTVRPPTRRGFGTRAIEQMLASEIDGRARLDFAPDGLRCTIEAPVTNRFLEPQV